jgi:hypothetical protein
MDDYFCRVFEILPSIFHELKPFLRTLSIPAQVASKFHIVKKAKRSKFYFEYIPDSHLDNLQMPLSYQDKVVSSETLRILSTVFQMGIDHAQTFHEAHHNNAHDRTELNGIDPNETSEERVSGISLIK